MRVQTGSATVISGRRFVPDAAGPAARPWAATGSMAIDDLLVWAVGVQRAGANPLAGLHEQEIALIYGDGYRSSSDGCTAAERFHTLDCRIDVSGPGGQRVSPVAEAVLEAAQAAPEGEMLVEWARIGIAPDGWEKPARCAWPRYGWLVEGVEAVRTYDYAGPGRCGASTAVIIVDPGMIAGYRARYLDWWDALEALAWSLSTRALGFVVAPPAVPREPWLTA